MPYIIVQSKKDSNINLNSNGSGVTTALTWSSPTTAGNLLVANLAIANNFTVTCSTSGWVQAKTAANTGIQDDIWYKPNCAANETAPVFTIGSGVTSYRIEIAEVSGVAISSPLSVSGTATASAVASIVPTVSSATTKEGLFVYGGLAIGNIGVSVVSSTTGSSGGSATYGAMIDNQTADAASGNATGDAHQWATSGASGTSPSLTFNITSGSADGVLAACIVTFDLAPIETLNDTFLYGKLKSRWNNWGAPQVQSVIGTGLVITVPNASSSYYGIDTLGINQYSIKDSYQSIELFSVSDVTPDELEVDFQFSVDSNNRVWFLVGNSNIQAYQRVSAVTTQLATATYNNTTHRYLRLRETSGTMYWETSTNGKTWSTFHSVATPIGVVGYPVIDAGCYDTTHGEVIVTYRNFNVSPIDIGWTRV